MLKYDEINANPNIFIRKVVTESGKMIRRHGVASYGVNLNNLRPIFMLGRRQMDI